MIDVHYWTTPNGHKVTIFLEETGLKYKIIPVNIGKGEQFKAEFLTVSPNNRIPAIVDHDPAGGGKPISVFESGAILLYLADKTGKFVGKRFAQPHRRDRMAVLADGRARSDGRAEQSLQQLRGGEIAVRDGSLSQRGEPALRRDEQAARRSALSRRRIFDRRHGELSVDRAVGAPGPEDRRLPASASAGSTRSRRGPRWSRPTSGRRRSIPARAASAPRKSARSCSARPRSRSPTAAQGAQ